MPLIHISITHFICQHLRGSYGQACIVLCHVQARLLLVISDDLPEVKYNISHNINNRYLFPDIWLSVRYSKKMPKTNAIWYGNNNTK